MNHLPYEEWLLSDTELTADEQEALRNHLQTCSDCQRLAGAWRSVASAIITTPVVAPAPGFTERWQARLVERRAARQRRQTGLVLLACVSAAIVTLVALALPQVGGLPSWVELMGGFLGTISQMFSTLANIQDVLGAILMNIPLGTPLLLWIVFSCTLVFWSLIWMLTIWRLPKMRRSQNEARK